MTAQSEKKKIAVLIVDDHKLLRETWSYILNSNPHVFVIAEADNGKQAIAYCMEYKPDVIMMDINMSPMNGYETTKEIIKILPNSKILAVSMHSQPSYAKQMLLIGASGYITKNASKEEMVEAIFNVSAGKKYIGHEIKAILAEQLLEEKKQQDISSLSNREIDIIKLIKKGQSSREMSQELKISLRTVEVHRHNILKKLKLKNTAVLINYINNSCFAYSY